MPKGYNRANIVASKGIRFGLPLLKTEVGYSLIIMKNVKLILNDGNHTSFKAFYLCAFILLGTMLFCNNSFAQAPNIITYQGKLTMQGTDVSGERTITARLYSDAEGTEEVWEGTYKTYVTDGIFALPLGAGKYPLPAPTKLDKQLWVGINVDGVDLLPLTQLTSSPYALNVADKSITKAKLADELLIGMVGGQDKQVKNTTSDEWGEDGNSALSATDYLGTSDGSPLPLKVNAKRVVKFEDFTTGTYQTNNITGGYDTNSISTSGGGNVIAGGGYYNYSTISSSPNRIGANATTNFGFIGGGGDNDLDGSFGVIAGGDTNTLKAQWSFIGGGKNNLVDAGAEYAVVVGGSNNAATAEESFVGGGINDTASGDGSVVVGGSSNEASGRHSAILGGTENNASGENSAVIGGRGLTISGDNSFGFNAFVSSPTSVSAPKTAFFSNVDLWLANNEDKAKQLRFFERSITGTNFTSFEAPILSDTVSYILPDAQGTSNTFLKNDGSGTLSWADPLAGLPAWTLTGNSGTTSVGDGGSNFLGTIDNKAFEIHVNRSGDSSQGRRRVVRYEPNDTSANIIGGFNTNSISSGVHGSVIAGGGMNGEANVIGGNFGFIGGGVSNISADSFSVVVGGFSNGAQGAYNVIVGGFKNGMSIKGGQTIVGGFNNSVGGYGAFVGGGGGAKNADTVDTDADDFNEADGGWSALVGGRGNHVMGGYGFIGGGRRNIIDKGLESDTTDFIFNTIVGGEMNKIKRPNADSGLDIRYSFIGGGKNNWNEASFSAIVGGDSNKIFSSKDTLNKFAFIGGGRNNQILSDLDVDTVEDAKFYGAVIVGGINNKSSEGGNFIGGGDGNTAFEDFATIVGGRANSVSSFGFIGGGDSNIVKAGGEYNVITGGGHNSIDGGFNVIAGGGKLLTVSGGLPVPIADKKEKNLIVGNNSVIGGGAHNSVISNIDFATIGGGWKNKISTSIADFASIPGGHGLQAQSYAQTVIGSYNKAQGASANNTFRDSSHHNDRLFIVGNGTVPLIPPDPDDTIDENTAVRSNAYEVSNGGHAIVYDNLGRNVNAHFTKPPFDTSFFSTRPAKRGARYIDNTPIAWGRFVNNKLVASFGVDTNSVNTRQTGLGAYKITLDYINPYNDTNLVIINHGSSVVATIEAPDDVYQCKFISASPIKYEQSKCLFRVFISQQVLFTPLPPAPQIPTLQCNAVNGDFMFQVFGRE